ncbi:TolB family protein [Paenibacillus elgii]|uniref:TolB family protein n=1 Tax=Paenibacillus elgii TaxID=189691 RepID=UPI000FDB8A6F|nr:WD40 repeat domain-containing protein [Paenibacillus elgii]NEN86704.1 hypothetical protein [Paenibacillus elgii]
MDKPLIYLFIILISITLCSCQAVQPSVADKKPVEKYASNQDQSAEPTKALPKSDAKPKAVESESSQQTTSAAGEAVKPQQAAQQADGAEQAALPANQAQEPPKPFREGKQSTQETDIGFTSEPPLLLHNANISFKQIEDDYLREGNQESTLKYGEAIYRQGNIDDAVIYFASSGTKGTLGKDIAAIKEEAARGYSSLQPVKLGDGHVPSLSHDGRYITYLTNDTYNGELVIYDTKNGSRETVGEGGYSKDAPPVWSWDNRLVAFGEFKSLHIYNMESRSLTTEPLDGRIKELVWSKDHDRIAYSTAEGRKIRVYQLSTRQHKVIAEGSDLKLIGFSEDSKALRIMKKDRVYDVTLSDLKEKDIYTHPSSVENPVWSVDGEKGVGQLHGERVRANQFHEARNNPVFFQRAEFKALLSFSYSKVSALRLNQSGSVMAFIQQESTAQTSEQGMLWVASTDGSKRNPVDYGTIITTPRAFSDDGSVFVYSKTRYKSVQKSDHELYMLKIK